MAYTLDELDKVLGISNQNDTASVGETFSLDELTRNLSIPDNPETIQENKPGFFKGLYKSVAEPVVNLIARPAQAVQHVLGDKEPITGTFLGLDITDPYGDVASGEKPLSVLAGEAGKGIEAISLGVGGAGAGTAVKTGIKGLFKQGVKEGLATGAKTGGAYGLGEGLQKDTLSPGQLAYDTLFGAGTGALFGGVLGGATPVISKTVTKSLKLKDIVSSEEKIMEQIAERNRKVLNPTQRMSAVEDRFMKDSPSFIAKEFPDMPIKIERNRLNLDDGIDALTQKYNAEELAFDSLLKNNGKFLDLNSIENQAKKNAESMFSGTQREKAVQAIENEMSAFARQAQQDGYLVDGSGGKLLIPSLQGNIFKRGLWQRTKGFGSPESEVFNQSNYLLGSAFKDSIETAVDDAPIKAMNKRLGDFISSIKYLEKRNGGVPGTGGKMGRYFVRVMGSIAGSGGGIPGSVMGAITADKVATFLANPELTTSMYNRLLKRIEKEGKMDILQQAQKILNDRMEKAANVIKLPAPGQSSFNPSNIPIIPPAPTTYEKAAEQSFRTNINPKTGDVYRRNLKTGEMNIEPNVKK